jgi:hypothetical protein
MITTKQKQPKRTPPSDDTDTRNSKTPKRDPPPFVTYFKSSEGVKYKLGDKLDHNGATFYFCDCPLHLNKLKWHTHHPDKCSIRNHWLKQKDSLTTISTTVDTTASISEENSAYHGSTSELTNNTNTTETNLNPNPSVPTQDVKALLANAINLVTNNDIAKDLMCDALNAFNNM